LKKLLYILLILACASHTGYAAHIVGGDMYYECLGGDNYRIHLKVYRDCFVSGPNVADYDSPAFIGIFGTTSGSSQIIDAYYQTRNNIPPTTSNPCFQAPANVCVEEAEYIFEVQLPAVAGGYDIVYQRCCRNATIININTPDEVGATYTVHIDPQSNACNNSPSFTNFPPIVICAGQPLVFDHSATDPDGDQLKYEFCTPYIGGDQLDPQPTPLPSPFGTVVFAGPYSTIFPLAASPGLAIDQNTGLMTGTPTTQGQYVVGVLVKEFRNGVQIGEIRRDFQFNVTQCNTDVRAQIPVIDTVGSGNTGTTGLYERSCEDYVVNFVNHSVNATYYHWDFGDLNTTADTSNAFQPTYTYPDTGLYVVTLVANPGFFCEDITRVFVRIYPGFNADFSVIPRCQDEEYFFNDVSNSIFGTINSWAWDFDDGATATTQHPQHLFPDAGTYNVKLTVTDTKGCVGDTILPVLVFPEPEAAINTSPACLFTTMAIYAVADVDFGSIVSYEWDLGNGQQSTGGLAVTAYNTTGSFDIRLITTTNYGCVDTAFKTININPLPVVVAETDTIVCLNEPVQLLATGADPGTYIWTPATGLSNDTIANPIALPPDNTTYQVIGTDTAGCKDTTSIFIDVRDLPPTDAGQDTFICIGDSYRLNGTGGVTFNWTPPTYLDDPNISAPFLTPDSSISYALQSVSIDGCINYDTVFIEVQFPIDPLLSLDKEICRNDSVTLIAGGGKFYLWEPPDGLSFTDSSHTSASPDSTTQYHVIISNNCFADTLPVTVTVNQLPDVVASEDDTIRRDDTTIVSATGAVNYIWMPRGLTDSTLSEMAVSPFLTQRYEVTGTDAKGCKNTDTVRITVNIVNLLQLPNAFTPDKDGHNDLFRITKRLNILSLIDFSIYNRWGERVFQTTDLDAGWDGTFNGEPQGLGVFVWYVKALNRDGIIITRQGNVTLVR
jgi:gliding motility-associated-like protein